MHLVKLVFSPLDCTGLGSWGFACLCGLGEEAAAGRSTTVRELARLEAEGGIVDGAKEEEVDEEEEGAGDAVEDTVPDHLGVGGDDVGALSKSPADGVAEKNDRQDGRGDGVAQAEVGGEGALAGREDESVPVVCQFNM